MIVDADRLDEALAAGATLPARWYADPEILRLEEERIFSRTWQYAGLLEDVSEPGAFLTATVGRIPVVVVRGEAGELNAFVNVCRHRGHLVAQGSGRRSTLQCPYHAWTYGLDGSLRSAPRCDREPGFDASGLSLLPVQVGVFGPLVLVNPDLDAAPLAETVGDLAATIADSGLDLAAVRRRERVEWEIHANWKVTIENYLECYHCPTAHPGFSKVIDVDPDAYVLQADGFVSTQLGPVRESARNGDGSTPYSPSGPVRQAQYHFVWPSLTINIEAGPPNISFDTWRAVSPSLTVGTSDYFFGADVSEKAIEELVAFSTQVGNEDVSLVESVQRGLESGMVPQGRLLPQSERLIQHFQRLVFDALAGDG